MVFLAAAEAGASNWLLDVIYLLAIPALVALNGLFVAAEFALVGVRRTRVEELLNQGIPGAKAVDAAVQNLDKSIAATQLGITLASIGLGTLTEPALARLILPGFAYLPDGVWQGLATHGTASAIAFILITFLHVVFGELMPKTIALQLPDRTALWVARPLLWFTILTRPLVTAMNGTGNFLLWLWGFQPAGHEAHLHSVEELELLIEDTQEAGLIDHDQAELLTNVFALSDKTVAECMVPREKMAVLASNAPPDAILDAVRQGAHTRMPVYDGDLDEIVGIVNTKDLFYLFSLQGVVILQDALYPPLFLRADDTLGIALRTLRKSHRHMALVRDDADKVVGLITLEDVIEEIIGEIEDEHDRPGPRLRIRRIRTGPPLIRPAAPRPAGPLPSGPRQPPGEQQPQ